MSELSEEIVRDWGARDVALWLQEIGSGDCVRDFRTNGIDGPALLSLTMAHLRSYPSLSDAAKRDQLKANIASLPGSALARSGLSRKASRERKKKGYPSREESISPPPLPDRPQVHNNMDHHHHQQQYDQDEDEYSFDDDDSFDSDSDFYDEDDGNNIDNKASLAPPEQPAAAQSHSIRQVQAKLMAFGLRNMDNQQLSTIEQQYLEENEDDEQDVYDVPPELQHQYYFPPEEDDDEGDIYDVPPEEAQSHYPPPAAMAEQHQLPPKNYTSSPQPVTKLPQLKAPIKQAEKTVPSVGKAANVQHNPPVASASLSDRMKAFENKTNDTSKDFPPKPSGKQFGNSGQPPKVDNKSPKLPSKFPKSPQLPPKNPNMLNSATTKSHNQASAVQNDNSKDDDDDDALSNMPEHLRDRFLKSRRQSKQRKDSRSHEDPPNPQEIREPSPEMPSQQKSIASNPFLQKQAPKSPKVNKKFEIPAETAPKLPGNKAQDKLSGPGTGGKSIKDRMKMFSSTNSSTDEPPSISPGSQKWPPSNSFERKQPGLPAKPPVEEKKMFAPKPFLPNGKEAAAVPPLPNRNTKPPKFSGSRSGDINKRPPMPLPATSFDDEENYDPPTVHMPKSQSVDEENYDPPQLHSPDEIMEENYDPPQFHREIQEDTYDPPPMPKRIPASGGGFGGSKPPRFPPKEDRRITEPALPPRPPKSNMQPPLPSEPINSGRWNTFGTPTRPPAEKPAQKPAQKAPKSAGSNPLESYPWYHGDIDRKTTESALERDRIDGCFIVRNPSKADERRLGFYSLSIWHCGKTRHLRIRCRSDKRYVVGESKEDERPFDSVAELIKFHKKTPLLLKSGGSTLLTCLPSSLA